MNRNLTEIPSDGTDQSVVLPLTAAPADTWTERGSK